MFLDDEGPISGGRELWGFPKKLAKPTLRTEVDTLVGTLDYGPLRVKPFLVSRRVEKNFSTFDLDCSAGVHRLSGWGRPSESLPTCRAASSLCFCFSHRASSACERRSRAARSASILLIGAAPKTAAFQLAGKAESRVL